MPEVKRPAITQVFMEDERQMLIKHAMEQYANHRDTVQIFTSLAIAFLLYVPLRRGELVALRFDDLDGNRLYLTDSYSHDMKCLKGRLKDIEGWRIVDVVPPALEIIERIRQEKYGSETASKLGLKYITLNELCLTPELIKK